MDTDFPLTPGSEEINGLNTRVEEMTLRGLADDDNDNQHHPHLHPLYNVLILDRLFGYLKLEEIKQCRSVCKKWNNLSEPFLQRLSKVIMTQSKIQMYLETFGNSNLRPSVFEFPRAFTNEPPLQLDDFEEFLRENKHIMEELHYEGQYTWYGVKPESIPVQFDMSLWIGDNLKVLKGHHEFYDDFFVYSTIALQSLKEVSLRNCTLNIVTGALIKSSKVRLTHLKFFRDGKSVSTATVSTNQFLDLSQVKELTIPFEVQLTTEEHPLDFNLLELYHYSGRGVLNWKKAKGTIEELKLTNFKQIPKILCGNEIVIKKIHLFLDPNDPDSCTSSDFDPPIKLSLLPSKIEKLEITVGLTMIDGPYFDFKKSGSVNFPVLKYLEIANMDDLSFLRQLADCPSLQHLYLFKSDSILNDEEEPSDEYSDDSDYYKNRFCVSSLPKSLKTLALSGYKLGQSLNEIHKLDHLYLQFYDISAVKNILTKLPAKHVYLDACLNPKLKTNTLDLVSADLKCKTLTVGPFTWTDDDSDDEYDIGNKWDKFHGSKFAKRMGLDQESEYYVFENGKGKAITKDKFKKSLKESNTDFSDVPISKRDWLL